MVEDRITDSKRIAQLLSSELTGRESGPLRAVDVVDAEPEAEPSEEGAFAFAVTHRDDRVGEVEMYPGEVAVRITRGIDAVRETADGADGVRVESTDDEAVALRIEYGAAVKRAVDAFVAGLSR